MRFAHWLAMVFFCYEMGIQLIQAADAYDVLTYKRLAVSPRIERKRNEACDCYDVTDYEMDYECRCMSQYLTVIPRDLGHNLTKLTLSDAKIVIIKKTSLDPYRKTLRDV